MSFSMPRYYLLSKWCPRVLFHLNIGMAKVTLWGPWPFLSIAFGWLLNQDEKVHALQIYFGIKVDGSVSSALHAIGDKRWVMVLTPKELAAFRIRWINHDQMWNNQAGA